MSKIRKTTLACLLALPATLAFDEIVCFVYELGYISEDWARLLLCRWIQPQFHTVNLQTAVAGCFYLLGVVLYVYQIRRKA